MTRDIDRLKSESFDVLVIGGGINGAEIARLLATSGARTGLVEKNDFASGASGKTTKLIHGGIRYLEQLKFGLVYESLHERAALLEDKSDFVKPLEFIIPSYKGDPRSFLKIRTGVFIYGILAGRSNIRRSRAFGPVGVIDLESAISREGLEGGVTYYDAQMDDVGLCLDVVMSAKKAGAVLANNTEVVALAKENGRISGAEVLDKPEGKRLFVRAKTVINATGAWSNGIVKMDDPSLPPITRPTKGVHIVYRKLAHTRAILLSARRDKRVFFVIPWRGNSLIGTTDTEYYGSPDDVSVLAEDVEYLLGETRRVFPGEKIDESGIISAYAGLRPLVNVLGKPSWQVSREHLIQVSKSGLVSVVGGKYTTYRRLARAVLERATGITSCK